MAKITKEVLKGRYHLLPRAERQSIGEALLKVNMGVALPEDQKKVAGFLKGSAFIAKAGILDELINFLHDDNRRVEGGSVSSQSTKTMIPASGKLSDSMIHDLSESEEDGEPTVKMSRSEIRRLKEK